MHIIVSMGISRWLRAMALCAAALGAALIGEVPLTADKSTGPADLLISRQLAQAYGLAVGDVVTLATAPSGAGGRPFRIAGVYEPTPDPMRFTAQRLEAELHLPDLLALSADPQDPTGGSVITALNLRLTASTNREAMLHDLAARLPGLMVRSTSRPPDTGDPFAVLERFHLAIAVVTVFGSTAFLLALMVMNAEERRETIGILRLIGLSKRSILLQVLVEGLLVAVAGAVFGVALAFATQGLVNHLFQWRYDTTLVFVRVSRSIAARSVAVAIPLGIVAGLTASWTLLRGRPAALFRR